KYCEQILCIYCTFGVSPMRIFEQDLLAILDSWETGDLHEKEVFTSAEKLAEGYDEEYFPQMPYENTETGMRFIFSDKRYCWSILPAEILAKLAEMHHEWVMMGDIPVMRMLLEAKEEDVEKAWMKWE